MISKESAKPVTCRRFNWPALLLLFLSLTSCGKDTGYTVVDFSKDKAVSQNDIKGPSRATLSVAVAAMISPKETAIYYRELLDYLGDKAEHEVELVQRKTYGEVNELLAKGRIDLAFICTGPYVYGTEKYGFEAVATPLIRGKPTYQSYLIVHKESSLDALADLKHHDFAFTDPDSNTGALVPQYWLKMMGTTPEAFFRSFTYTFSHDNAIMAVAKRLVDGAAVDGHMWEYYQKRNDFYSAKTRVIRKSEPFGSPPLVAAKGLDPSLKKILVDNIMSMHSDAEGSRILNKLMIDRFVAPQMTWYLPVKEMLEKMRREEKRNHAAKKS